MSSENSPKMTFSNLQHSNSVKYLIYIRKTAAFIPAVCIGDAVCEPIELV